MGRACRALIACCAILGLTACASLNAQTEALESQSRPKDARMARLYFIRPGGWVAQGGTISIKVNGQDIGGIAHASYLFVDRPPGVYTLEVMPPVLDLGHFQTEVQVAAGGTYYYSIAVQSQAAPLGGGGFVMLGQSFPGTPMKPKDGISFATFRLNMIDSAAGPTEIAKLRAH